MLAFLVGTLIGTVAGWRRGGAVDSVLPPVFVVTSALPYFWVGMMLILVFSVWTNGALPNDGAYEPRRRAGLLAGRSSATSCSTRCSRR